MKILVTGGAGYIGSVVAEQLVEAGESVVVFDSLYQGHRAAVHPDAIFVRGDLADRAAVDAVLSRHRPEAVMHFASHTLVGESMHTPFLYLGDNVTNGLNLLQSAVEHGVRRFIECELRRLLTGWREGDGRRDGDRGQPVSFAWGQSYWRIAIGVVGDRPTSAFPTECVGELEAFAVHRA